MNRVRLHNALFALALGCVLGVTLWMLAKREPGLFRLNNPIPPFVRESVMEPLIGVSGEQAPADRSKTEALIEEGKLSQEPAKYWKKP